MNNKLKKILLDLSDELGMSTDYLEKFVTAGSTMIFNEDLENLERKLQILSVSDDLLEETLLCCAYGEALRRLVEVSK